MCTVITHYIYTVYLYGAVCLQNLTNLAPKKIDWDLKRDISKKLDKLERRTQKAILELLSKQSSNFNVYVVDAAISWLCDNLIVERNCKSVCL